MSSMEEDRARSRVRDRYAQTARGDSDCACAPGCCGPAPAQSLQVGYSAEELATAPDASNLGLGCGNPGAFASLRPGETVVDLGSGAGLDCFLAAEKVGTGGRVIGVDMTPEMITRARAAASSHGVENVEFRLGEIEHLPVEDTSADVILSNCVINLSPDKAQVFRDAFRVLRPGGRLAVSDVVALAALPAELREDSLALSGCVAGAARVDELRLLLAQAGFEEIHVEVQPGARETIAAWFPGRGLENLVASASIEALKPEAPER